MKLRALTNRWTLLVFLAYAMSSCRGEPTTPPIVAQENPETHRSPTENQQEHASAERPSASPTTAPVVGLEFQQVDSPVEVRFAAKVDGAPPQPIIVPIEVRPTIVGVSTLHIPVEVDLKINGVMPKDGGTSLEEGNKEDFIGHINSGDLLTLMVILATYVAALRFFLFERVATAEEKSKSGDEKARTRSQGTVDRALATLKRLLFVDVLLVAGVILLSIRLLVIPLLRTTPSEAVISLLFLVAIVYLARLHFQEWQHVREKARANAKRRADSAKPEVLPPPPAPVP